IDTQKLALGDGIGKMVAKSTEEWRASAKIRKLWQKDKSVWTGDDENKWLGWLDSPASADIADYEDYAQRVKGQKFSDAVVLGMGGSSLGPEVLAETFARKSGFPKLHVLDSTDPAQVWAMEARIDIANTVFIVSSKSGGTAEPNAMKDYFHERGQTCAPDGPLLRTGRAAARKPRRAARACHGSRRARRPRQGDDPDVEEDRRFRRLGRAAHRRIDRQGRQGPDPDCRRAARRALPLRQRSVLHRHPHRRRGGRPTRLEACRDRSGRPSRRAHRHEVDRSSRPGILPFRDGDGG